VDDNFMSAPNFRGVDDYLIYQKRVIDFINTRNDRIEKIILFPYTQEEQLQNGLLFFRKPSR
jgi:hypothetical protein